MVHLGISVVFFARLSNSEVSSHAQVRGGRWAIVCIRKYIFKLLVMVKFRINQDMFLVGPFFENGAAFTIWAGQSTT